MRKYMVEYIKSIEEKIESKHRFSLKEKQEFKDKLIYFQNERLIHLIVTCLYVILALTFMILGVVSWIFIVIFAFLIIFLLFYIPHYFFLENSVQYMYKLYDKII